MYKKYIRPNTDIHDLRMQYSLLEHSEHVPGDEEEEFNVKERDYMEFNEEMDEEVFLWELKGSF